MKRKHHRWFSRREKRAFRSIGQFSKPWSAQARNYIRTLDRLMRTIVWDD